MTSLLLSLLFIGCAGILFTVSAQAPAPPFYHLPNEYHFDGTGDTAVKLTDLICVKEDNARTIKFQMRTSTIPPNGLSGLIGIYVLVYDDDDD